MLKSVVVIRGHPMVFGMVLVWRSGVSGFLGFGWYDVVRFLKEMSLEFGQECFMRQWVDTGGVGVFRSSHLGW